jgi:hypothetical protein
MRFNDMTVAELRTLNGTEYKIKYSNGPWLNPVIDEHNYLTDKTIGDIGRGAKLMAKDYDMPLSYNVIKKLMDVHSVAFQYRCMTISGRWGKWHDTDWMGPIMYECAQIGRTQWKIV